MSVKRGQVESALKPKRLGSSKPPLKSSLDVITVRRDLYRARLVFYLVLASLGMFFLAALTSYIVIRTQSFQPIQRQYLDLQVPKSFWISTGILILVSVLLHRAVWLVRRERLIAFRRWLVFAWVFAIAFLAFQYSGMTQLLETHFTQFGT